MMTTAGWAGTPVDPIRLHGLSGLPLPSDFALNRAAPFVTNLLFLATNETYVFSVPYSSVRKSATCLVDLQMLLNGSGHWSPMALSDELTSAAAMSGCWLVTVIS